MALRAEVGRSPEMGRGAEFEILNFLVILHSHLWLSRPSLIIIYREFRNQITRVPKAQPGTLCKQYVPTRAILNAQECSLDHLKNHYRGSSRSLIQSHSINADRPYFTA